LGRRHDVGDLVRVLLFVERLGLTDQERSASDLDLGSEADAEVLNQCLPADHSDINHGLLETDICANQRVITGGNAPENERARHIGDCLDVETSDRDLSIVHDLAGRTEDLASDGTVAILRQNRNGESHNHHKQHSQN